VVVGCGLVVAGVTRVETGFVPYPGLVRLLPSARSKQSNWPDQELDPPA
jgi:hypothetical protein